jgi:viologen exporter family transport system permease protein
VNLRGARALISRTWMRNLSGWGFEWMLAFGHLIETLVYMFVWVTIARQKSLPGIERDELVVYYLIMMVLHEITYPGAHYSIGAAIRSGGFSTWLLRPLSPIFSVIASDLADKAISVSFTLLTTFILGLVLQPAIHFTFANLLLFLLAAALAYFLRFLQAYVLALLAFWTERADAFLKLSDTLLFIFAGQVAPFALLPHGLQVTAAILPYRYMLGFPVEVLQGQLSPAQLGLGFLMLLAWIGLSLLAHQVVWKRGLRRYSAVGG